MFYFISYYWTIETILRTGAKVQNVNWNLVTTVLILLTFVSPLRHDHMPNEIVTSHYILASSGLKSCRVTFGSDPANYFLCLLNSGLAHANYRFYAVWTPHAGSSPTSGGLARHFQVYTNECHSHLQIRILYVPCSLEVSWEAFLVFTSVLLLHPKIIKGKLL